MGTIEMPMGSNIPVHRHDHTEEILYITRGTGKVILGDEHIDVGKDTTVRIPPGAWHGLVNPDDHMQIVWFVTPPGLDEFFRGMFRHRGEDQKRLSPEEIAEIEELYDSKAKR